MRRSSAIDALDRHLAAGHAGERHERADLDVVGRDGVVAAVRAGRRRGRSSRWSRSRRSRAPILTSMRARSCTCGSEAALRMTVSPGVSAAAISAFSVAITDGSSIRKSQARQAARGGQQDVAAVVDLRAERLERVEVRVEPAAADHVAAGRRHQRAAVAREQRAGEQEARRGCARTARGRSRSRSTPSARIATSLSPRPLDARAELADQREHRLDVARSAGRCARRPRRRSAAPTPGSAGRRSCCPRARRCRKAAHRLG